MKANKKLRFLSGVFGVVAAGGLIIGCNAGLVGAEGAEGTRRASGGGGESCRVMVQDFTEAGVSLPRGTQVTLGECVDHEHGTICGVQTGGQTATVARTFLGPCPEVTEAAQPEEAQPEAAQPEAAEEPQECGPEPHYKKVGDRCLPSCGRAMGDAALAKHGSEDAYLSFGACLQADPSSPCDTSKGHRQVESWDCGMTCCIYPEGDSGAGADSAGGGEETGGEEPGGTTENSDSCSVSACCGVLTDDSKLIPSDGRTFDGEVAKDNFCFIADQGNCCYQTHCHGDWVAGYEAAKGC